MKITSKPKEKKKEKPKVTVVAGREIYHDTYGRELAEYLDSPELEKYLTDKYKRTKTDKYFLKELKGNPKKIAGLMMADAEFQAALLPYLKDRPLAKLGLDSYAFDAGKITPENYRKRLLNIESRFTAGYGFGRDSLLAGAYDPGSDKIQVYDDYFPTTYYAIDPRDKRMGKSRITSAGNKPRTSFTQLPNRNYGEFVQRSRREITKKHEIEKARKVDDLVTLLHELEHRGLDVLEKLNEKQYDYDYVKSSYEKRLGRHEGGVGEQMAQERADEHQGIYARDMDDYLQLGYIPKYRLMPSRTREFYPSRVIDVEQKMYMDERLKENPELAKRFPSITRKRKKIGGVVKSKYMRGGKVYSNQPRKVRVRDWQHNHISQK